MEKFEQDIKKAQLDRINAIGSNFIEKGHKAGIGEIRQWGDKRYKKQPNGKWMEVSEHGMTKKEHEERSVDFAERHEKYGGYKQMSSEEKDRASKLSDKEHDESELESEENKFKVGSEYKTKDGDTIEILSTPIKKDVNNPNAYGNVDKIGERNVYKVKLNGKITEMSENILNKKIN